MSGKGSGKVGFSFYLLRYGYLLFYFKVRRFPIFSENYRLSNFIRWCFLFCSDNQLVVCYLAQFKLLISIPMGIFSFPIPGFGIGISLSLFLGFSVYKRGFEGFAV